MGVNAITEEQLRIASLSVITMAESDLVVSDLVECEEVCIITIASHMPYIIAS